MKIFSMGTALPCLALLLAVTLNCWAIDSRFVLDPAEISRNQGKTVIPAAEKRPSAEKKGGRYTIQPGDSIRSILKRHLGLNDAQTDAMVERVKEANDIKDIHRLKVGASLIIPGKVGSGSSSRRHLARLSSPRGKAEPAPSHGLRLLHHEAAPQDNVTPLTDIWPRLMATAKAAPRPSLDVANDKYTLSFDTTRYPILPAVDGGKILLDTAGTLPPLVRSLVNDKDQSVRIVTEDPANRRRFVAAVLGASRFYSVDENFVLELGQDPRLKIYADFKIERTADSLMKHDMALLNLTEQRQPMPRVLVDFLKTEGFQVLEPFSVGEAVPVREQRGTVYRLAGAGAIQTTDTLLQALALPVSRDRSIELFSLGNDGVKLDIKADRLFEERGERYVVCFFDGDPVAYTLSRLLETRGYRVIVVDLKDDFQKVSERVMGKLRLNGTFGIQTMNLPPEAPFAIQLTGVGVGSRATRGKQVILTTSAFSPLVRELAELNGFEVID